LLAFGKAPRRREGHEADEHKPATGQSTDGAKGWNGHAGSQGHPTGNNPLILMDR
jgi:hypothetical protein